MITNKKKQKSNILLTILNIVESMWNQCIKDCHCHENGIVISAIVKVHRIIKQLYGICESIMPDNISTSFVVNLDTYLNNSLSLKQS